jgi:hypothetical protein
MFRAFHSDVDPRNRLQCATGADGPGQNREPERPQMVSSSAAY